MAGSESAGQAGGGPAFLLLFDAPTREAKGQYDELVRALAGDVGRVVGFEPKMAWVALPERGYRARLAGEGRELIEARADELASHGYDPLYLVPVSFDFGLHDKQWLTEYVRAKRRLEATRPRGGVSVHYDAVDAAHPLLVESLVDAAGSALSAIGAGSPGEVGVLLVANGSGDADTRAESYRVMRLVWERLGVRRGEVAFVRHPMWAMPEQLAACAATGLNWLVLPQYLFSTEELDYARVIFGDWVRHREHAGWKLAEPIGRHPNVRGWLAQRLTGLHRSHRNKLESRIVTPKYGETNRALVHGAEGAVEARQWDPEDPRHRFDQGIVLELGGASDLRAVLAALGIGGGLTLVKPTWHGYATGTYTDPVALELLLEALPGRALLIEGHTASRNSEPVDWDWEQEAREHRSWVRRQEHEYFEKTGLREVVLRHGASYVNVTEHFWDERCVERERMLAWLAERGVRLQHPELAGYVPEVLFEQRGQPLVSLARFKGPTRLSLSNLFGLLPQPLRTAWHGPNITYFARVCCDLAKLYGALFRLYGVVESVNFAVRWERRGLYRSRWGNYDLLERPGVVCVSRGVAAADVLASRLQGHDVRNSAFFDVVRTELGFPDLLGTAPLPSRLVQRFV